ncbi:MAG: type II secretion system protein GspG, partial [Planctomycetes bacterium]|nr:type II secretion system protein GspG [Planctomycetota bacterium]
MHKAKRTNKRSGFTMIELMAVLIILGLLSTVAMTKFIGQIDRAKRTTTKTNLGILHSAIINYRMDVGSYPEEGDPGLYALIEQPGDAEGWQPGGYLESTNLPLDGWKKEFIYVRDYDENTPFVIISLGADGE